MELGLAQSLNGDAEHDAPVLAMLVSDVTTGIQLNSNNTLLVSESSDQIGAGTRADESDLRQQPGGIRLLQYLPTVVADEV